VQPSSIRRAAQVEQRFAPDGLPIRECISALVGHLSSSPLVALKAPPGSGKTIFAPLALLEEMDFCQVLVLEPRRVTARLPALALDQVVGDLVGYRIRLESRWNSGKTRLGYLTYGTALRVFWSQPPGPDTLVVFDEFHERTWEAELLLAYLRGLQNPPRLLLMSATLDLDSLPPTIPVVQSDGKLHRVALSWEVQDPQLLGRRDRLASLVAERSAEFAARHRGEQLIFLPGLGEIKAVAERLTADHLVGAVDILHSSLPEKEIRRVVERPADGRLRRILSTDLAESSVTLPGITTVIDSGLVRRPIRDALDLGITLKTEGASLSALEQRAGRAGRLGPGVCHRLFTRQEELHRAPFPLSEMEQADYRTLVLFLTSARFAPEGWNLPWLYPPNPEKLERAKDWCTVHGLLKGHHELSARGRAVLGMPLEPRLANFALLARESGHGVGTVINWCGAIEAPPPDAASETLEDWTARKSRLKGDDKRLFRSLEKILGSTTTRPCNRSLDEVLLTAYSDSVAQLTNDRAVCSNPDQTALLFLPPETTKEEFAIILSSKPRGGRGPRSSVGLYHPISSELMWEQLFDSLVEEQILEYDPSTRSVKSSQETRLGQLVLEKTSLPTRPGPKVAEILRQNISESELGPDFRGLIRRLELLFEHEPNHVESLRSVLGNAQEPVPVGALLLQSYLSTVTRWTKRSSTELLAHCIGLLPYDLVTTLERKLPKSVTLPGRKRPVSIEYPDGQDPHLSSKLQDFFGWDPPKLLDGKLKLTCHLLAPNGRACQITTDLPSFWSGSYKQVRKDLRGRYPKHNWPEDPTNP
jgi:ATP-dependent RNA helicase HrpB